jgi:hypothetical protein
MEQEMAPLNRASTFEESSGPPVRGWQNTSAEHQRIVVLVMAALEMAL